MPFGLTNAPTTFQQEMVDMFRDQLRNIVVFLDDILIYSRTLAEHTQHVQCPPDIMRETILCQDMQM